MSQIYVVMGTTGEYSDRSEWGVIAFRDEERAKEHVLNATRRAKEIEVGKNGRYDPTPPGSNEFDPAMAMDYTGTEYFYMTVELRS